MDDANGTLKGSKATNNTSAPNGINGAIKSQLNGINGHAVGMRARTKPRGPGMFAQTFSIAARLLTWYSIVTILLRCPATLDACDDTSPRICKPYFQLKQAVVPHVEPYYDTYAAPYVEAARPYYYVVDQRVIAPSRAYAKKYGAPRVQQVQAFGKAQWDRSIQPQVEKYQGLARTQYDEKLAPHIHQASAALGPYYEIARTSSLQTYHELLVPVYQFVHPHVLDGYRATSAFTSKTVVPSFVWAWNKTYVFVDGTVGPQIKAIYVENVEPQLVKIGKRLGRHSSGKKSVPKPLSDASASPSTKSTSTFTKPAASVTATSTAAASASSSKAKSAADSRTRASMEPIPPPEIDEKLENEDPVRRSAREIVAADLKDWQERYAKAADEGAAEIDQRVQEIAKNMIRREARITGKSFLEQLQTTAVSELVSLRRAILDAIGTVNKGGATPDKGHEQITQAVRQAGMAVKEKAQAVRTWREQYDTEMQVSVTKAAETHFSILENIRDLALQKIGMKWAWMDGVTYKDWAKYHQLKGRFDEWKGVLERHVVSHPSLEAAQLEAANIEDEAMQVAASAAKELARLKQVAYWKLTAGDDTEEFDSTLMQQAAEAAEAARQVAANAAGAVVDSAEAAKDSVVDAIGEGASLASDAASKATDAVFGLDEQASASESASAVSGTSDPASEPAAEASMALEDSETSPSDAAAADEPRAEPVEAASEHVDEDGTEPEAEPLATASEELSSVVEPTSEPTDAEAAPEVASTMILEEPVMVGNVTAPADEDKAAPVELPVDSDPAEEEELPVSSTASVKPALFGAAAQSVPNRKPILDDDADDLPAAMESMRNDLKSAYSTAMSRANHQYSQALSIISAQVRGTPQPAQEKMLASVTSAYSHAMASASSRLDDALKVASSQLYGSTTTKNILPTTLPVPQMPGVDWAQIQSIASERLQQGRALAEEQYASAKIAIGLATLTPSTPSEHASKMLDNARHNYYAGLGLAHARYSEFLAAASSALSSATATPTPTNLAGSASSMASVASGSASSAASAVSEGAASVASAASEGASIAVSAASENVSAAAAAGYDAAAAAGDRVAALSHISVQVYGAPTPTPWYSSVYSAAGDYASAAGESGASVTSAAGAYASAGSDELARQYAAVSSIMSEVLVGKEPSFSESVVSRLSAAYATGLSSASSVAGAAQATAASAASQAGEAAKSVGERVASAASDATEAVRDAASSGKDEL
ncbi:hypothetical protein N658DRAFT_570041 [Parathielavia hyrcaniae]|uniref:Transcription factor hoxa13 n=1 Tax=Parathielavia hyrcaniae TaxID=113614 RepID=A0AAN6PQI4_9PEZI|nr:hypothetical protein N658DRAFT_570041 [Parathielavia hyrcaniae]